MQHLLIGAENELGSPVGDVAGTGFRFVIVVVAYDRVKSLRRLLKALGEAAYGGDSVDVIISIDCSAVQSDLVDIAESWEWGRGKKAVRAFSTRQGLRSHVLACGDCVSDYDAVIILEDDLFVSREFYRFAKGAVEFYAEDPSVAGLSLYAPAMNEMVERPFIPLRGRYDVYALQSAQSWGQCWTRAMWDGFRRWYEDNRGSLKRAGDLPEKVYSWPDTSWKKYFMKYLVVTGRTFVYPYESLSTNSTAVGQHHAERSTDYEVPVLAGEKEFRYGPTDRLVAYDAFFERSGLTWVDEDGAQHSVCVDLYGSKWVSNGSRYFLTRKRLGFEVAGEYGLGLRPQEYNFEAGEEGGDIRLYDLGEGVKGVEGRADIVRELNYHITVPWKFTVIHGFAGAVRYVGRKVVGWFRR